MGPRAQQSGGKSDVRNTPIARAISRRTQHWAGCEAARHHHTPNRATITERAFRRRRRVFQAAAECLEAPAARGECAPPQPGPEHCRHNVGAESPHRLEHHMDVAAGRRDWNGKFLAVGNGGWAGTIQGYGYMQRTRCAAATPRPATGGHRALGRRWRGWPVRAGHPEEDRRLRVSRATTT